MPALQNGQTHPNNSLVVDGKMLSVFDHLVGLAFKGLRPNQTSVMMSFGKISLFSKVY